MIHIQNINFHKEYENGNSMSKYIFLQWEFTDADR